jgi:hypothetical protein
VYKIDNVDFAKKDIRILDSTGQPSHAGRVEFRVNGRWGSVCNKNNQESAIKMMCTTLGYLGNYILNQRWKKNQRPLGFYNWCLFNLLRFL